MELWIDDLRIAALNGLEFLVFWEWLSGALGICPFAMERGSRLTAYGSEATQAFIETSLIANELILDISVYRSRNRRRNLWRLRTISFIVTAVSCYLWREAENVRWKRSHRGLSCRRTVLNEDPVWSGMTKSKMAKLVTLLKTLMNLEQWERFFSVSQKGRSLLPGDIWDKNNPMIIVCLNNALALLNKTNGELDLFWMRATP